MGIIVTIAMLLLLAVLRPSPWSGRVADRSSTRFVTTAVVGGLLFGAWNAFYGLRQLTEFWGLAALTSGFLMLLAALVVVIERSQQQPIQPRFRVALIFALACCFLLYFITLVQINLGLPYLS